MRLRAVLVALFLAAALSLPAAAVAGSTSSKPVRRLGAGWAAKRAVKTPPPSIIVVRSRARSAGTACRSSAKG